ncbi:MAG: hypothetical protein U9R25_18025 [Chloroflexota bacterium]|nr:hypothetical protein [Chloroflexota bacterium]
MRKNPSRTAWVILTIAFSVFCLLATTIPLGIRYYLVHARAPRTALLQVSSGTVLLATDDADEPIAVVDRREVPEGTLIQTDQTSQASLVFPSGEGEDSVELATVHIYPNGQMTLVSTTRPRFSPSKDADHIEIDVGRGRVRVNRAELEPRGLLFDVSTPQAQIRLDPGSYAVDVSDDLTQVSTRFGNAVVTAEGKSILVETGHGTQVAIGQPPSSPHEAADNLISNGDFQEPLGPPTWLINTYPEEDPSAGQAEVRADNNRQSVRFWRINQPPTHSEVGITQVLDHNVSDYEVLNLQLDVMLRWQSLPGAGELSSEFPLMIRLDYEDIYGNHQFWIQGFYYRDPPDQWVVTGGEKIPSNVWFPFESGNLIEQLPEQGLPPPAVINYVKIYASGHNYDSMASEVRLMAR